MNVFVTGGTGFVAQQVVKRLAASGHRIRLLARSPDSDEVRGLERKYGVEIRKGDVTEEELLRGALPGTDAVIHLVGIISEVGRATFENVHREGTRNVVAVARKQGVKRFFHM